MTAVELATLCLATLLTWALLALACVKKSTRESESQSLVRNTTKATGDTYGRTEKSYSVKGNNTATVQETTIQVPTATEVTRTTGKQSGRTTTATTKPSVTQERSRRKLTRDSTKFPGRPIVPDAGDASGEEETEQLSDYESRRPGSKARNTTPPEVPPPSPRARERRLDRRPLGFAKKGRVKLVPMDQTESWDQEKSRLIPNPERRNHVLRTLHEMGGWLIDRTAPDTGEVDNNGEKILTYIYVSPKPRQKISPPEK